MIIFGIVLFGLAVVLFIASISQKNRLYQMQATETSTAAALKDIAGSVASEIGAGSFSQITEVKGKGVCENPITSELAQKSCVYYSMRITREWEEEYWDKDSEGRRVRRTRRGSDTISSNTRSVPFYVDDGTGKILVNPSGCSAVAEKVMNKFEPGEKSSGAKITIGKFSISLGNIVSVGGRRTLGYRYEEEIIPLNCNLYVLGEATDKEGELKISKPDDKKQKFIVSIKSEEELVKGAKSASTGLFIASVVCAIAGAVLIVLHFVLPS
jgi:hypothetical protein